MRRVLFMLSLLLFSVLLNGCGKEKKEESETIIPNSCTAELYHENGQLGIRILKAEGSLDVAASLEIEIKLTGRADYYDYKSDFEAGDIFTEGSKEFKGAKKVHPSERLHVAKGEKKDLIDVKELFSIIENNSVPSYSKKDGKLNMDFVNAYVTDVDIIGKVVFYRTKEQVFKDHQKALANGEPESTTSLYDPVESSFDVSFNADILSMSGKLYPEKFSVVTASFNGKPVSSFSE